MLNPARLEALRHKHNLLARQIEFEEGRPAVNRGLIVQLKREKMRVKEILSGIRGDSVYYPLPMVQSGDVQSAARH